MRTLPLLINICSGNGFFAVNPYGARVFTVIAAIWSTKKPSHFGRVTFCFGRVQRKTGATGGNFLVNSVFLQFPVKRGNGDVQYFGSPRFIAAGSPQHF